MNYVGFFGSARRGYFLADPKSELRKHLRALVDAKVPVEDIRRVAKSGSRLGHPRPVVYVALDGTIFIFEKRLARHRNDSLEAMLERRFKKHFSVSLTSKLLTKVE